MPYKLSMIEKQLIAKICIVQWQQFNYGNFIHCNRRWLYKLHMNESTHVRIRTEIIIDSEFKIYN